MVKYLISLFFLLIAGATLAETTSILLPDLAGQYAYNGLDPSAPNERVTVFRVPEELEGFEGLRMRLFGVWEQQGEFEIRRTVGGIVFRDTLPFSADIQLILTSADLGDEFFLARGSSPWGTMDGWEEGFYACCPSRSILPEDMLLLMGKEMTATLSLVGVAQADDVVTEPRGRLDEVLLVFDWVVLAEPQSWGALKALYR